MRFYRTRTASVSARITDASSGKFKVSTVQNVAVMIDSPTVDVSITQPAAGTVRVGEGGTNLAAQASTSADFGPRGVNWTLSGPGGWQSTGWAGQSPTDPRLFATTLPFPGMPLGRFTLTMRATRWPLGEARSTLSKMMLSKLIEEYLVGVVADGLT